VELRVSREASPIVGYRIWELDLARKPSLFELSRERESQDVEELLDFTVEVLPMDVLRGSYGRPWTSPVLHAECERARHPAPQADCTCGIYAVRSLEMLPTQVVRNVLVTRGAVRLEGRVIEHERGWRGEYATMEWLEVPAARPELGWTDGLRDGVRRHLQRLYPEVPILDEEVADGHR
jgi:hypothetical protein